MKMMRTSSFPCFFGKCILYNMTRKPELVGFNFLLTFSTFFWLEQSKNKIDILKNKYNTDIFHANFAQQRN